LKRLTSILFVSILLFNWFGYHCLSYYFTTLANKKLETLLDDNSYDESELVSIRLPALYAVNVYCGQFRRVNGEIEIGNVEYKYVKVRLINDSLELLCIPNHDAMRIQSARDQFFKLVNDLQQAGQGKKSSSHPESVKNYKVGYYIDNELLSMGSPFQIIARRTHGNAVSWTSCIPSKLEKPPDRA
jgi:hypothetical protein